MRDMETRLYELRKKTGLSQDELAEKIGVSRQTISKWERGEALPDTENLIALAKLYNVTLDDIVNYKEDDEAKEKIEVVEGEVVDDIPSKTDDENVNNEEPENKHNWLTILDSSLFFVALIAFLLLGFIWHFWAWCWLTFLLWIVVISLFESIKTRNANKFAYAVMVTMVYLFVGINYQLWHPTWVAFLSIPLYYTFVGFFSKKSN